MGALNFKTHKEGEKHYTIFTGGAHGVIFRLNSVKFGWIFTIKTKVLPATLREQSN